MLSVMGIKRVLSAVFLLAIIVGFTEDKAAYRLFNSEGKKAKYGDLIKEASKADVILFGEEHNSPMSHWLQLELTKDIYAECGNRTILGAEMFESDGQTLMNEYLNGQISERSFEGQARLWDNYKTDYKPLVEFARENNLAMIATNIPRRYASAVYMGGMESLEEFSEEAKSWIAPLPIQVDTSLSTYKEMFEMGGDHGGLNLVYAQAVKDATMAHFILENLEEESVFIHYNGAFHNKNNEGIYWYLKQSRPDLTIVTISSQSQESIEELNESNTGVSDYILVIPENMTKTY